MIRRVLGLSLVLGLAAGCDDDFGPLEGDIYVLQSIAGDPVPAPYAESPGTEYRIIADTLAFAANGSGARRTVYDDDGVDGGSYMSEETFTYTRSSNRVEILFHCADTASCIAGPHLAGDATDAGITFDISVGTRKPLVFRRLFPPD